MLVSITGMPGAGKSTISNHLTSLSESNFRIALINFDGYHIPLAQLRNIKSHKDLVYYRGCWESFEPQLLLKDVQTLMDTGVAYFPKFDHAIGDPEYSAIKINKSDYDIVIIEGIYLNCPHLSEEFNKVNNLFDYRI